MRTYSRTDSANAAFQKLIKLLDADLLLRDGEEHSFYAQFNHVENIRHVIICRSDDVAIACGAFKEFDSKFVEIKRMFVQPEHRRQNIAVEMLQALEDWAAEINYTGAVLETGRNQPEAIQLYKKAGYTLMENYGQYRGLANSVCFQKRFL